MSDNGNKNGNNKVAEQVVDAARAIRDFIRTESGGGFLLIAAAVAAIIAANSPLHIFYDRLLETPIIIGVGQLELEKPFILWVNDGLMAVFFLLIGLEIKRERSEGKLSRRDRLMLPAFGAVGGMLLPAAIYVLVNIDNPGRLSGWAIPSATDIAFALGVMAILGKRVPLSLKVMLTTIAVIDDLGAITIVALYYTGNLSVEWLLAAAGLVAFLYLLNRSGMNRLWPFLLIGAVLWYCVLKSGVHATLAGVVTAFAVPITESDKLSECPLKRLEEKLNPWVSLLIMPLFAFCNAGLTLGPLKMSSLVEPIPLGIILGLLLGKPLGILGGAYLATSLGLAKLPRNVNWRGIAGVGMVAGIGFTMSLFIGGLDFESAEALNKVRLGILFASTIAAVAGLTILTIAETERSKRERRKSGGNPRDRKAEDSG